MILKDKHFRCIQDSPSPGAHYLPITPKKAFYSSVTCYTTSPARGKPFSATQRFFLPLCAWAPNRYLIS